MNTAARLGSVAAAGELLVSAAALERAGLESAGLEARRLELKGREKPTDVFVRGPSAAPWAGAAGIP